MISEKPCYASETANNSLFTDIGKAPVTPHRVDEYRVIIGIIEDSLLLMVMETGHRINMVD